MLKAIAIDDEPIALEVIKTLAENVGFISIGDYFTNSFKAMEYLQKQPTDLIFLDIKMPGISGIEFLKSIPNPPMVIFTTAYSEHAVQSFELDAIDYLLKPFSLSRFLKACNKAHEQFELRNNKTSAATEQTIFIKSGYEKVRINLEDIRYVESISNYVRFVLRDKSVTSRLTMQEAIALLPQNAFIRIHRSYLAAKNKITRIDKRTVWLDGTELSIGESYYYEIEKFLNNK